MNTVIFNTGETQDELKKVYNPEGSELRKVQLRLLDLLLYIDKVCKEIGVDYRLDGGNVLGAVRHQGFIPWDDDVDVAIDNLKDYRKLCSYLKKNPHPQYVLQDDTTDPGHIKYWNTLRDLKSEYIHQDSGEDKLDRMQKYRGLQVDIFPFEAGVFPKVYLKYSEWNRKEKWAMMEHKFFKLKLIHFFRTFVINPVLHTLSNIWGDKSYYMHSYGAPFSVRVPKEVLLPHKPILFEGYEFPGPADPYKYCELVYGNYMDLPPKDERNHHNVTYNIW